jgi:hypothetical protein
MEAITPLDLSGIQAYLQNCLQQEFGEQISCEVNCWVQEETLLVFIQCLQQDVSLNQTVLGNIRDHVSKTASLASYQLKIFWAICKGVMEEEDNAWSELRG